MSCSTQERHRYLTYLSFAYEGEGEGGWGGLGVGRLIGKMI